MLLPVPHDDGLFYISHFTSRSNVHPLFLEQSRHFANSNATEFCCCVLRVVSLRIYVDTAG